MRQLAGGRAHRPDRHLVVHPLRSEQADGAELAAVEPVGRADERRVAEAGMRELDAEADERPALSERVAEEREQRRPLLERLEQWAVRREVLRSGLPEQVRGAADEEALLLRARGVRERRSQQLEKPALAVREPRLAKGLPQRARAERPPDG